MKLVAFRHQRLRGGELVLLVDPPQQPGTLAIAFVVDGGVRGRVECVRWSDPAFAFTFLSCAGKAAAHARA